MFGFLKRKKKDTRVWELVKWEDMRVMSDGALFVGLCLDGVMETVGDSNYIRSPGRSKEVYFWVKEIMSIEHFSVYVMIRVGDHIQVAKTESPVIERVGSLKLGVGEGKCICPKSEKYGPKVVKYHDLKCPVHGKKGVKNFCVICVNEECAGHGRYETVYGCEEYKEDVDEPNRCEKCANYACPHQGCGECMPFEGMKGCCYYKEEW